MKKKLYVVMLITVLLMPVVCLQLSYAAPTALELQFEGTQAICSARIYGAGLIEVRMELWKGNRVIASWSGKAQNYLSLEKVWEVPDVDTYTLKLNGTIKGIPFPEKRAVRSNWMTNAIIAETQDE